MRALTSMAVAAAAVLSLSATNIQTAHADENCADGEIHIKFSHVTNTDRHPKGIAAELLAQRVNAEMDGKACMTVFPNSQLYDDNKVLEALLLGDVQMAAPSLSKFEKYTKQFRLFDLPFMFASMDAVDAFQNSKYGQAMKDSMRRRGIQGLEFWHNGLKQMSATRPLVSPKDAEGLKFRVQPSDVLVAQFEQLGGNPQKMAFSEVYGALQTKTIDGQENTWSNIYGRKFFEVQDGTTETNHGVIDYLVVTSVEFWQGLPGDVRDQLATILREVTETRNSEAFKVNEEAKKAVIEAGGVVRTLNSDQRADWVAAMKPVWSKFEGDIGSELIEAAQSFND